MQVRIGGRAGRGASSGTRRRGPEERERSAHQSGGGREARCRDQREGRPSGHDPPLDVVASQLAVRLTICHTFKIGTQRD